MPGSLLRLLGKLLCRLLKGLRRISKVFRSLRMLLSRSLRLSFLPRLRCLGGLLAPLLSLLGRLSHLSGLAIQLGEILDCLCQCRSLCSL